jgi:hypothetical protein
MLTVQTSSVTDTPHCDLDAGALTLGSDNNMLPLVNVYLVNIQLVNVQLVNVQLVNV